MKIIGRPTVTPTDPEKFSGVTDEQIAAAVEDYIAENPVNKPTDEQIASAVEDYLEEHPIEVPDSGCNVDLTGYATEEWVRDGYQPKGEYLTAVPDGYAKTEDVPTKPEDIGAQPVGDYLTEVPSGYATEEYVKNKIAEAELSGEEVDLSGYAQKSELPTKVSQLENDKGYLTQHQDISGKLDASALPTAINTALAQAKASGEFDGKDGIDGKDGQDGYTPKKGIDYFDGLPGKDGADGKDGYTPVKGKDYFDGNPGKDGTDGADGVSPTVSVSKSGKVTTVSITDKDGTKTATINDGADGSPGSAGKDGTSVTVKSVSESTADGGSNVVTFSDEKTLTVKNGKAGTPGKTPVKGTDYFTEADKAEMVEAVLAAHPAKYEYAIENVLCIGDSLTAGACDINGFSGNLAQNYPYYLGRMLNCETKNGGAGGKTIAGWYTSRMAANLYDWSKYDSIIVWLGTNSPCTSMPTDAEISAFVPDAAPDDATANHALYLCKMVETLKAANPDCFIMLLGIFAPAEKAETHNAVALKIANKYGVYYVDMSDLGASEMPELHGNLHHAHFGKAGNIFVASRICNFIRKKIADNPLRAEFGYGESGGNVEPDNPTQYTNRVPTSIDTDGTVFNGKGYQDELRLSSSGTTKTAEYSTVTGYIPAKPGDIIRIVGVEWYSDSGNYICAYDNSFNFIGNLYGEFKCSSTNGIVYVAGCSKLNDTDVLITLGTKDTANEYAENIAYIRVSSQGLSASRTDGIKQTGANMIVTVNEEIT